MELARKNEFIKYEINKSEHFDKICESINKIDE